MPKEPYYIEYNPEGNEEDESDFEDDERVPNQLKQRRSSGRIRESDMGIVGGAPPTVTLDTDNDFQNELDQELALQQEKYQRKLEEKAKKQKIKSTKRQIRHLKYKPVYDAGETLKGAGESIVGKIQESRGTPGERKEKRAKMVKRLQGLKEGTKKMATALGTAGAGATGSGAIQDKNAFFGVPGMETNMFAREVGGSGAKLDLVTGGKPDNKANNLIGKQKMGAFELNLLGGGSDHKDIGSVGGNIFGGSSKMFGESQFFSTPSKNKKTDKKKPRRII